jgi:hypothetical protein
VDLGVPRSSRGVGTKFFSRFASAGVSRVSDEFGLSITLLHMVAPVACIPGSLSPGRLDVTLSTRTVLCPERDTISQSVTPANWMPLSVRIVWIRLGTASIASRTARAVMDVARLLQAHEGELACSINGDEQMQLAFSGAQFGDVDVEIADGIALEALLRLVASRPPEAADADPWLTAEDIDAAKTGSDAGCSAAAA